MRGRTLVAPMVLTLAAASVWLMVRQPGTVWSSFGHPAGRDIKCALSDGRTPCSPDDVESLNSDISKFKQLVTDGKSAAGDGQQATGDTKQATGDAKQLGSDAKHPVANAKQLVGDAQQVGSDGKQVVDDGKQVTGDAKQVVQDAKDIPSATKGVLKDLKGIGSIALKSMDGKLNCKQNDGSPCNDDQTNALKTQAAQKQPPLTIIREVDHANP